MAGGSISPPGVKVIQSIVSATTVVAAPTLPTVLVGPCFQNVSALSDLGVPLVGAFAGTYKDGLGVIAYDMPSLLPGAVLSGFERNVRTFLVYGGSTVELKSVFDAVDLIASTGSYVSASRRITDTSQVFIQSGVAVGDVVRLSWRGESLDVEILSVDSDTELTLSVSILAEDLTGYAYSIVRNPSQFIFNATLQANAEIGLSADYFRVTAATLKEDGISVGDYVGSKGDSLSLRITDSQHFLDGTDGAVGGCIFSSASGAFITSVGARGSVGVKWLAVGALGDGDSLRDISQVISNTLLTVSPGEASGLSTQAYRVLDQASAGTAASVDATGNAFTGDGTELFLSTIPNTAGTPNTPTLVEIVGVGTYVVSAILSNTTLTLVGSASTQSLTGVSYTVAIDAATGADGATGALTDFVSLGSDLSTLVAPTTKSVNAGGSEAHPIASVVDADQAVLSSGFASSGSAIAFSVVSTTEALALSWDPANLEVVVQVERAFGISSSTYSEINDAISSPANTSYSLPVSDIVDSALGGTVGTGAVTIVEADLGASGILIPFDGGSNKEQLLLDADLLASTTPTAQVYVSYKALRTDVSAAAAAPKLLDIRDTTQIAPLLGAPSVDNPLALGALLALQNSPTRSIKVLGISGVSATKPEGTVAAYTEAFSFLEGHNVHLIAPLTSDLTVAALLSTHVTAMSLPAQKAERIGFFSSNLPLYKTATAIASGISGNSAIVVGSAVAEFSASTDFASAGVVAGDILVVGAIPTVADSPEPVPGTVGPFYGVLVTGVKSTDSFVLEFDGTIVGTSTAWDTMVDVGFTVYRSGVAITQSVDQAEVIAQVSESFASRRVFHHWPDEATIDLGGLATIIPGYYIAAGWAGKFNGVPARQGFSNATLTGYLSIAHSNGPFSRSELDRIAGGGTWITVQTNPSAKLSCRHQLSTDASTIERREASITRVLDYVTWYLRAGLNNQTGTFNITQSYLDALAVAIQGLLLALKESGTVIDATLSSLEVDPVALDKINIVIAVKVPYPSNYLEITLQV